MSAGIPSRPATTQIHRLTTVEQNFRDCLRRKGWAGRSSVKSDLVYRSSSPNS